MLTTKEISSTKFQTFVPRHHCPQRLRDIFELRTGDIDGNLGRQPETLSAGFLIGPTTFLQVESWRGSPPAGRRGARENRSRPALETGLNMKGEYSLRPYGRDCTKPPTEGLGRSLY